MWYDKEMNDLVAFLMKLKEMPIRTEIEKLIIVKMSGYHYQKMREELKSLALESDLEKLKYWIARKLYIEYMSIDNIELDFDREIDKMGNYRFLHKHIQNEIDSLEILIKSSPIVQQEKPEPLSDKDIQKVVYLHELGVIEFLKKRLGTNSLSELAFIVSRLTGIKQSSLRKQMERAIKKEANENNYITARALIAKKYGTQRPLPDIKFDSDIE